LSIKDDKGMTVAAYICDAAVQNYYIYASSYILTGKAEEIRRLLRCGIGCENNIK
jgi:hypothetical protein